MNNNPNNISINQSISIKKQQEISMMRQILRAFNNSVTMPKTVQFRYATEAKNIFVLPKKNLLNPTSSNEAFAHINESYTVKMISYLFRDNIKYFLDIHVGAIYEHIVLNKLQLDDTMYSIIVPITIEYLNVFTIQNAESLGQIAINSAKLNLQSEKLWEVIFKKLDTENIYTYLNHVQVVLLLEALVEQGAFINHPLITKLCSVVAQQKAYYNHHPELLCIIKKTADLLKEKSPKTLQITEAFKQVV